MCMGLKKRPAKLAGGLLLGALAYLAALPRLALAAPVAVPPYSISVFATSQTGYSDPDDIAFDATNVFVGYGNGGMPDGSGGAMSTLVEYSLDGKTVVKKTTLTGHLDGLKIDGKGNLWAMLNEDANTSLAIINLKNGKQTTFKLGTGSHGGGFDDIVFDGKQTFFTASNPTTPGVGQAIVSAKVSGKKVTLTEVLANNATTTNVLTGSSTTLDLSDPDSMILDPFGELVLASQGDGELIVVRHPALTCQKQFLVPLSSTAGGTTPGNTQADDTVFATESSGTLLVADKAAQTIYAITAPYFAPGAAYSSIDIFSGGGVVQTSAFVGKLDLSTGFETPIVTGLMNPGGIAFLTTDADNDHGKTVTDEEAGECP